jgi:hypothetical protein
MIQPVTLRLESNGGQENTTYFNREDLQIAMMLQLRMLRVQLEFWFLKSIIVTNFHSTK